MRPSYGNQAWCQYYETISKKLSRVLRYERHRQGLPADTEGYVSLADLCTLEMFRKDSEQDILKAAKDSQGRQGPRFHVDQSGHIRIKACYTHDDKYPGGVHPSQRRNTYYNDSYGGKGHGGKGHRGYVPPPPDEPHPSQIGSGSANGGRAQASTSASQSQSSRAPVPGPQRERNGQDPLWKEGSDDWANGRAAASTGHREQPASKSTSSSSTSRDGPPSSGPTGGANSSSSTALSSDHNQNGRTRDKPSGESLDLSSADQDTQAPRKPVQQEPEQDLSKIYERDWNDPQVAPVDWTKGRGPSVVRRNDDEARSDATNQTPRSRAEDGPFNWKDQVKDDRNIRGAGKTTEAPEKMEEARPEPISKEAYEDQYGADGAGEAVRMGIAVPTPAVQTAESQDVARPTQQEDQEEKIADTSQQSTAASAGVETESAGPEKDWEKYKDEEGKDWFWRSSTDEFFFKSSCAEKGWENYLDPTRGSYWLHEESGRHFFEKDLA